MKYLDRNRFQVFSLTLLCSAILAACGGGGGDDPALEDPLGKGGWRNVPTTTTTKTVPGAPTIGGASANDTSATISFTPPSSDGGSAITSYKATCSTSGASATGSGTASPVTVGNLSSGTGYTCSVAAINAIGTGPSSASVSVTTTTPAPAPAPAPAPEPAPAPTTVAYSAPIVISSGGTYSGNWASTDPAVPAVTVTTTAPVTIVDCRLRGPGHLISSLVTGSNITVRNCAGLGIPASAAGIKPGRFINLWQPSRLTAEYNTLTSTGGIYVSGGGASALGISVRYNKALNIEGRLTDGAGGYSMTSFVARQFFQMNGVRSAPNVEVAWNQIINEPGKSRVEDNISVYLSSGTAASPIRVHDNYVQGAYAADPLTQGFSGGGILTDGASTDPATATGYVSIYNNQVVGTSNYGIAIASGHDVTLRDNRAIASGLLPSGQRIYAANVGAILVGQTADITAGTFANNNVTANTLGWINAAGAMNHYWFPSCSGTSTCTGNLPLSGSITTAMEAAERTSWNTKLAGLGLVLGSTLSN